MDHVLKAAQIAHSIRAQCQFGIAYTVSSFRYFGKDMYMRVLSACQNVFTNSSQQSSGATTINRCIFDNFKAKIMVSAWYMDDSDADQRLHHKKEPCEFVSLEQLKTMGVDYWYIEPETYATDSSFLKIKKTRGYSYQDQIEVSPTTLQNYEEKIKSFYDEHIHTDEEIRYVLDGSGYFDVRDPTDEWVRIEVTKGDMIVLPAGIYHRFTLDSSNYIKALRLFVGEPVWTPYSRSSIDDNHPSVLQYKSSLTGDIDLKSP